MFRDRVKFYFKWNFTCSFKLLNKIFIMSTKCLAKLKLIKKNELFNNDSYVSILKNKKLLSFNLVK